MSGYKYKKIDAFTSGNSLGNPAACIYMDENSMLTAAQMLSIAKQHKGFVSEMVYCNLDLPDNVKLTYYSSECEVDFCGHGTIACLYELIRNEPDLRIQKEFYIKTNKKGTLTVYNEIEEENSVFITAPEAEYIGTDLKAGDIAPELNLQRRGVLEKYPVDLINAGLATLIVPVASLNDEVNTFPDERRLKCFCLENLIDIVLIFSFEVADKRNIAHTRVFAPRFGYLEDPATGSGNSAFGYYMLKNGLWDGKCISIEQGGADRMYNTIKLRIKDNRVLFGGSAAVRIIGEYFP